MSTILDSVIQELDYSSRNLFDTGCDTKQFTQDDWLNKSDWIVSAQNAGVEKMFFVNNNPVVVFARCSNDSQSKIKLYNKIWCLSRPRLLFLESDGELSVIDLAQKPVYANTNEQELLTLINLRDVRNIAEELQQYHRYNIESGKVFEDSRFGDLRYRADQALIYDLKEVRKELINSGLSSPCTHALIGRSIFIRYLEDRKILNFDYLSRVARSNAKWEKLLNSPNPREDFNFSNIHALYPRILQNKEFTYAFFKQLAEDFNGDMFHDINGEKKQVKIGHLKLIQDLLYGDVGIAKHLFFYSYKFDIIPLDLISAIYEEFYHSSASEIEKKSKARQEGAYYTPPVLAEFVLSRVLTPEVLEQNLRILDPACGSGIFLVEAFRRMVRYLFSKHIQPSFDDLKKMLGEKLVGIEINEEAARITAFSLYVAMLNYLEPPSILEHINRGKKLPNLINEGKKSENHFNNIHIGNAFIFDNAIIGEIDIVVGNPPWGAPGKKVDAQTKENQRVMQMWCDKKGYTIGDKEPSQAFLLLASELVKGDGRCALLASAGVLLKHGQKSQTFRTSWVQKICITEVFNFTHVRSFFFHGSIAPFVLIHWTKKNQENVPVEYWSAKQVRAIEKTQTIVLSKYDRAYLVDQDLTDNKTWKINWFGRHGDYMFLSQLKQLKKLINIVNRNESGQGYIRTPATYYYPELQKLPSLLLNSFEKYSVLTFGKPPEKYYRSGVQSVYEGKRLLVKRGISEKDKNNDFIIARYETSDFCFTNSINGIKITGDDENIYLILLGIFWSSFSTYFYFNITAGWGCWHHEIHLDDELLQLPIPSSLTGENTCRVITIAKKLRDYHSKNQDLLNPDGIPETKIIKWRKIWEKELDEAVFDLYCFTERQRDLIRDFCEVTLPFFYDSYNSIGAGPVIDRGNTGWIKDYAVRFAACWKPYLEPDETLRADLCIDLMDNVAAIEFFIADIDDDWDLLPKKKLWQKILSDLINVSSRPMGTSQILLEGIIQIVTEKTIIIIKRNEKRFWTKSIAYEDAESAITKRILSVSTQTGESK